MPKTRDSVFDIMKGFAMIVVIIIHTMPSWQLYHFLSFFHVPLFFMISGFFVKESSLKDFMTVGVRRLLIPIFFMGILMISIVFLIDIFCQTHSLIIAMKSLLLGSASWPSSGDICVLSAGPLWFLWALMFVRLYWIILKKIKNEFLRGGVIVVLALVSCYSKEYITIPFSIQASFGALGFFYAGYLIKGGNLLGNNVGKKIFTPCLIAFAYCMGYSNIDVNLCIFRAFYVIDILAVIAVFFIMHAVITKYKTESRFWLLMNFVGRYSLIVLCVHAIDQNICVYWLPYKIWSTFIGGFQFVCAVLLRIIFAVGVTYLISKNKFLCEKIFFIK